MKHNNVGNLNKCRELIKANTQPKSHQHDQSTLKHLD